jgi:plastocyanin
VRNSKSNKTIVAGLVAVCFLLPRTVRGADADIDEVRRQVHQLEAQVQALRAALSETAELDRQRASVITRALKNLPSASEAAAPPAVARSEPPPSARPAPSVSEPAASRPRAEPSAPSHHASASETSVGTVRGRVQVPAGEPVAYVYVDNLLAPAVKGEHKVIQQSGKKFMPGWAVVQRGTEIAFPNLDNIYHNVFSMSPGNQFDLGLYNSGGEPKSHTFLEPGPVDVYCNIHPQMAASVLVVPNRYYAKVKGDGSFEISGVPVGRRKIVAWAPGSRPSTDWVEIGVSRAASVDLKLEPKGSGHKNKSGQSYGSYE